MQWFVKGIKNYTNFQGRARRKEYWMFYLFSMIFSIVATALDFALGIYPALTGLYSLFISLPTLALTIRRLHDIGKSGAWFLIILVPFVGAIILFIFTLLDSQPVDNQYGSNPKMAAHW